MRRYRARPRGWGSAASVLLLMGCPTATDTEWIVGEATTLAQAADPCGQSDWVWLGADNDAGTWLAARLDAVDGPVEMETIRVTRLLDTWVGDARDLACSTAVPHGVLLFSSSDGELDDDPEVLAEFDVPAQEGVQEVELGLDTPLRLATGDHAVVAVELAAMEVGGDIEYLCVPICADDATEGEVALSQEIAAPYGWGPDPDLRGPLPFYVDAVKAER